MIARNTWHAPIVFVALVALRVPYFLTHHIQEDAYIVFRTAFNLADHGDYSFNLGEHLPGSTSSMYPLIIAVLRLIFGGHAIAAVQIVNTALTVIACYLMAATLIESQRARWVLWIALACLPTSLFVSYYCMETALLIFAIALVLHGLNSRHLSIGMLTGMFLLPLIRPDAIGFGLVFVAAAALLDRKKAVYAFMVLILGVLAMLAFNFVLTGHVLTETVTAKEIAMHPNRSLGAVASRIYDLFVTDSFLMPVSTKFFIPFAAVFSAVAATGVAAALILSWRTPRLRPIVLAMLGGAVAVPLAYAYGGVLMEWYVVPSAWLAYALMAFAAVEGLRRLRPRHAAIPAAACILALLALDGVRYLVSVNVGTQEADYRVGIGKYVARIAAPDDTLLLEPAGYIPFYAGLRTYDEVGLISRPVIEYRERYGQAWWINFVKDKQPTYIIESSYIIANLTHDEYPLSPAEMDWFHAHYDLVAHFHYDPNAYATNELERKILRLGTHSDYLLFRLHAMTAPPPRR